MNLAFSLMFHFFLAALALASPAFAARAIGNTTTTDLLDTRAVLDPMCARYGAGMLLVKASDHWFITCPSGGP